MQAQAPTQTPIAPTAGNCDCPKPMPVERAEQRGAAVTYCARCDRPVPIRWTGH